MKTVWELDGNVIKIVTSDGNTIIPSANEVYSAVYKGLKEIQSTQIDESPSHSLPGITFSKIPLRLSIQLSIKQSPVCSILASSGGEEFVLTGFQRSMPDHIIIEKTWYPFFRSAIEKIAEQLEVTGIKSPGVITLRQYYSLFRLNREWISLLIPEEKTQVETEEPNKLLGKTTNGFDPDLLYSYQKAGLSWLNNIRAEGLGCILGDEMGLGKTLQIIGMIALALDQGETGFLIVAPATLLENWRREFTRFAPRLSTCIHRGIERTAFKSDLKNFDVIITSYDTIIRDMPLVRMIQWSLVVLDEAQAIKNPRAKRTLAVKDIPRSCSVAVTGTPVENSLVDLWSIMDFVLPEYLGTMEDFESRFEDSVEAAEWLEPMVTPILLRRRVTEVAEDLPEKIIVPQYVELGEISTFYYNQIRDEIRNQYGAAATFVALVKLRMFCTHPNLVLDPVIDLISVSNKYRRLVEILEEIFACSEKALIFTSFRKMVDLMLKDYAKRWPGLFTERIDGMVSIEERQNKVDSFGDVRGPAVMILNPKAGGTGLNITAANHVIHYNPEWNPATEDQASARSYRRGQDRPVTIHRLIYANTIEEVMDERLSRKRTLMESAVVGIDGSAGDHADIMRALAMAPSCHEE